MSEDNSSSKPPPAKRQKKTKAGKTPVIPPGSVPRTDTVHKQYKINQLLQDQEANKYWDTLTAFLTASISRIELEKVVLELLGEHAYLHNDIVLAILHNAALATEGLSEADAASAIQQGKTKNSQRMKKNASREGSVDMSASGMPSLALPASTPAGNAKTKKEKTIKELKKDTKPKDQVQKTTKVRHCICIPICTNTIVEGEASSA
jgi:hypothetical protein